VVPLFLKGVGENHQFRLAFGWGLLLHSLLGGILGPHSSLTWFPGQGTQGKGSFFLEFCGGIFFPPMGGFWGFPKLFGAGLCGGTFLPREGVFVFKAPIGGVWGPPFGFQTLLLGFQFKGPRGTL